MRKRNMSSWLESVSSSSAVTTHICLRTRPSRSPAASRGASGDKAAPGEYLVRRDAVTPSHQADGQTWLVRLLDNPDLLGRAPAAPTLNRPAVAYLVGNRMLR